MKTLLSLCAAVGYFAGCAVVCVAGFPALAENLPDPTKPPVGFAPGYSGDTITVGPQLQSILISPTRRIAIISGKTLGVGDKFGEAVLVAINDNEVVLQNGKSKEVLKLFPALRKSVANVRSVSHLDNSGKQR